MTPEGKVQSEIVKYARKQGFMALRFEVMQVVGFPDLMLLGHRTAAFIEVKRKGKVASKMQEWRLEQIRACGLMATHCDNIEEAQEFIHEVIKSK